MKIHYLGTGAAERVPAIFCHCKVCQQAKEKGGKEIRTQTQLIIDDKLLIDFPGDSYLHSLKYNLDLAKFDYLLLSHWHSDHFYGEDLAYRMSGYGNDIENKLLVFGNKEVKKFYDRAFELEARMDSDRLVYHTIKPYHSFSIMDYVIYPIPARHGWFKEDCFIFAISNGEEVFLSTHDTGYFTQEMFEYLESIGKTFSVVSLDCTGQVKEESSNHMNWKDNLRFINELKRRKLVTDQTIFIANHFSHNGGLTYDEMSKLSNEYGIVTSYDGLVVETKIN